jgi:hydroxymethylglutaryl-CoA reductase (NADPH)
VNKESFPSLPSSYPISWTPRTCEVRYIVYERNSNSFFGPINMPKHSLNHSNPTTFFLQTNHYYSLSSPAVRNKKKKHVFHFSFSMDTRRRSTKATPQMKMVVGLHHHDEKEPKASDALPLPLYLTNAVFFTLFFSVVYFLLTRWREKIRNSTPLHVLNLSEIVAIVAFVASFIYLLGFFGIDFVQSILRPSSDLWANEEDDETHNLDDVVLKEDSRKLPCGAGLDCSPPQIPTVNKVEPIVPLPPTVLTEEDEEIIKSVISGKTPSYSLESKLGDCKRAAAIRRESLQRITGKSLGGLPLEGFDYDSILGQCCEMPVGYIQIPVGIAGPLLLDGREYSVPMATTEGCLVASTNRGCKAIHLSGGANSVLLKDGMTRAPVVRFATAQRAAQLKFFLEDIANFETLSIVFNRSSRFARLQNIKCNLAGKNLYIRFTCSTGDAMGMNMISKGVQNVLDFLQNDFPDMDIIGISGEFKLVL